MWHYTRITWIEKFIVSVRKNARTRSSDSIDWLAPFAILDCKYDKLVYMMYCMSRIILE